MTRTTLPAFILFLLPAASHAAPPKPAPLTAVAFSPDGATLAVGGAGDIALLEMPAGKVRRTLGGLPGAVTALAYLPGGDLLAASGPPGRPSTLSRFGADALAGDGKPIALEKCHADAVYALAVSRDGRRLATGGYDRLVKVWAVPDSGPPALVHTLKDHSDAVFAAAFHPSLPLLATGSADRAVKVWDADSGKRLYTLSDPTDWVYAVTWSTDGRHLAAGGADRSLRLYAAGRDGGTLTSAALAHGKTVTHLFALAGQSDAAPGLVSVGQDRAVKSWLVPKLAEALQLSAQPETVLAAALNPTGTRLALARYDGGLQVISTVSGAIESTPLPAKPTLERATPDALVAGAETSVVVEGTALDRFEAFELDGVSITPVELAPSRAVFAVPAPAKPGAMTLRARSADGQQTLTLTVSRFAPRPMTATRPAEPVPLPATFAGRLERAGDVAETAIAARAGEPIGLRVPAGFDRAKFEPVLSLHAPSGKLLAESAGELAYTPATGEALTLRVRDRLYRGGPAARFQLDAGPVPVVESAEPRSAARGRTTRVKLAGVHLGGAGEIDVAVPANAELGSTVPLTLPERLRGAVPPISLIVVDRPAVAVPADTGAATVTGVPAVAEGVLRESGKAHRVRFPAQKGRRVVVEIDAERSGSPLDASLSIETPDGKPVERATLRAVARVFVNLRDHDAVNPGIRLDQWAELGLDDYLYAGGELMRIQLMPPTVDDDARFYAVAGRRRGFLGTNTNHHALGEAVYKVELLPPGSNPPPNGLPVVRLPYRSDDAVGRDPAIVFDPPTDGEFVAVVRDSSGSAGPRAAYRLVVREPAPRFKLSVSTAKLGVPAGEAAPLAVTAERIDEYDGPIDISFDAPPGVSIPPARIEAGQLVAVVPVAVGADAKPGATLGPVAVRGSADIGGKPVSASVELKAVAVREGAEVKVRTSARELKLVPGKEIKLTVSIERGPSLTGRVPLEVKNLPHGARVVNIGLSGVLILPGENSREVTIYTEPWVRPMRRLAVVQAKSEKSGAEYAAPGLAVEVAAP